MNRINKFFVLFIFFAATIIFGGWQIIQSPYFAKIVSNHINKQFISKLDAEIDLGNIEFTMFPPATQLKSVSAKKNGEFELAFEQLSLKFSFWDIFRSNLHISELEASNGFATIEKVKSNSKGQEIDLFKIIKKDILSKVPVNILGISILDTDIKYGERVIHVDRVNLKPYKSSIDVEVQLRDFTYSDVNLDEISSRVEILPKKIRLIELNGKKNTTKLFVNGDVELKRDMEIDLNIDYQGRVEEFISLEHRKKYELSGDCHCKVTVEGLISKPKAMISGELSEFSSSFIKFDLAKVKANLTDEVLTVERSNVWTNSGSASLKKNIRFNLKDKSLSKISVDVKDYQLHDSLHFLGDSFKIINGKVNGNIEARVEENLISITSNETVVVNDFVLDTDLKLLNIEMLKLDDLSFLIDNNVSMKSKIHISDSTLEVDGVITSKNLKISAHSKNFKLSSIGGQIGGLINGKGEINFLATGPLDDVSLILNSKKLSNFKILDYSGEQHTVAEVDYSIKRNALNINRVKSFGDGSWSGSGEVDFNKNSLDVNIAVEKAYLGKLAKTLDPIWEQIKPYVEPFDGVVDGSVSILGSFEKPSVAVSVQGNKVSYLSEPFSDFSARVFVGDDLVEIKELSGSKASGKFKFGLNYSFNRGIQETFLKVDKIKLGDLNIYRKLSLGYDALIDGEFKLQKLQEYKASGSLKLQRSSIGRKAVRPSSVVFSLENNEMLLDLDLMGGNAIFNTKTYIGKRSNEKSSIKGKLNIENLRTLLGIISLHNISDGQLEGELKGEVLSTYRLKNFQDIDIDFNLEKFSLSKYNKFIRLTKPGIFKVAKSQIQEMQIDIKGSGGYFSLDGTGDINKRFKVEQKFELDLIYAQLFVPIIERITGRVFGQGILSGSIQDLNNYHDLNLKEFFVKLRNVPVAISHGRARSILNNRMWTLNNFNAKVGDGTLTTQGKVDLKVPFPDVNLVIDLDNVDIPIKDNSSINIDSNLKLYGKKLPYVLEGAIVANGGRVEDEFTAFTDNSGFVKSVDKYIDVSHRGLPETVALDVSFKTIDSIRIKNRLSDIFFVGDMQISGNPLAPDVRGQLSVIPTISKFKFKGNEFLVRDGTIVFEGNSSNTPLALSFSSEARVNEYDVKMSVAGGVEDLQINLESNPALSKEDIFSLLTLGVTSDFSKNLEAKDRESLTRIGLGTLIVDQLKINEGLDSTLGLKLSVLPEVSESDDSPIETSKAEQQSKVKTATKLKIQKKITDNVGLTFSNTFGGEDGQKQEMNVDFNINDKFSIQGVFEKEEETQDDGENGSIGADIKYKWSF